MRESSQSRVTGRGLCIGNGILTVNHEVQATERADPGGKNKGGVAALAALHLIALKQKLKSKLKDGGHYHLKYKH